MASSITPVGMREVVGVTVSRKGGVEIKKSVPKEKAEERERK